MEIIGVGRPELEISRLDKIGITNNWILTPQGRLPRNGADWTLVWEESTSFWARFRATPRRGGLLFGNNDSTAFNTASDFTLAFAVVYYTLSFPIYISVRIIRALTMKAYTAAISVHTVAGDYAMQIEPVRTHDEELAVTDWVSWASSPADAAYRVPHA